MENPEFEPEVRTIRWNVNDQRIAEIAEEFKDVDAYKDIDEAKKAKRAFTKMRTTLAEAHKITKAEALEFGRKCDAEKNRLLAAIAKHEDPITEQLNEIKNAEAKKEEERMAAIDAALREIEAIGLDRHDLNLDQLEERKNALLAIEVTEEIFQESIELATNMKEDVAIKLRLSTEKERERVEEAAAIEAQRIANEEAAAKLAADQAKFEEEQREAREAREARDAEEKAKREAEEKRAREAEEARLKKIADEQAEAQRKIDEENARIAAEKRKQEEEAEAARLAEIALQQAPDVEKLEAFAVRVDELIASKPELQSDAGNEALLQAVSVLTVVAYDIRKSTEEMK